MKKILLTSVTIILALIGGQFANIDQLKFYVLDVGQGSSSLVRTKAGENILIDGGTDAKAVAELGKILPFYERTIDVLIVTHSHDDHVGGLIDIFERYDIKTVIYTGVTDETQIYKKLIDAMEKEKSKIIIAAAGEEFNFFNGKLNMKILYPINSIENKEIDNPNDGSIVTVFEQDKNKIIVTGDLEIKGEAELVDFWQNKINFNLDDNVVYVAGHHGSNTSSSKKFLDFIKPDYSLISVGLKNKFNHPSLMIVERLKARCKLVWRTDESGTLEADLKNNNWIIKPFKISLLSLFY